MRGFTGAIYEDDDPFLVIFLGGGRKGGERAVVGLCNLEYLIVLARFVVGGGGCWPQGGKRQGGELALALLALFSLA